MGLGLARGLCGHRVGYYRPFGLQGMGWDERPIRLRAVYRCPSPLRALPVPLPLKLACALAFLLTACKQSSSTSPTFSSASQRASESLNATPRVLPSALQLRTRSAWPLPRSEGPDWSSQRPHLPAVQSRSPGHSALGQAVLLSNVGQLQLKPRDPTRRSQRRSRTRLVISS